MIWRKLVAHSNSLGREYNIQSVIFDAGGKVKQTMIFFPIITSKLLLYWVSKGTFWNKWKDIRKIQVFILIKKPSFFELLNIGLVLKSYRKRNLIARGKYFENLTMHIASILSWFFKTGLLSKANNPNKNESYWKQVKKLNKIAKDESSPRSF